MVTMLLVDDHAIVREGLRALIETMPGFRVVSDAADVDSALARAAVYLPDIILLDLLMPGKSGASAIPALRKVSPSSRIVALSSTEDPGLILETIEAGACSLLLKSMCGDEIIASLKAIAAGYEHFHPAVTQHLIRAVRNDRQGAADRFALLSPREQHVLRKMAEGSNNARIAASLFISEKTVKSHLTSIFQKLGVEDRTEAVALAWRNGFMKSHGNI